MKEEKRNGPFEEYNRKDKLIRKGTFKNGKLDGLFESYFDNGSPREKIHYKDGVKEGYCESYSGGKLIEKGDLKKGKKEGVWEFLHSFRYEGKDKVNEILKLNFKNGEPYGPNEWYYESGEFREKKWRNKEGIEIFKDGLHKVYHKNGQLKEIRNYKNEKLNGAMEIFHDNGILKEKRSFINQFDQTYDKPFEKFYDNGQLKEEFYPDKNIKIKVLSNLTLEGGILKQFYDDGNLKEKGEAVFDIISDKFLFYGQFESYYENGKMKSKGNFNIGHHEHSFRDKIRTSFVNLKVEDWIEYFDNGQLKLFTTYKIISKFYGVEEHQNNVIDGIYIEYYQNGQLKEKGIYQNGEKDIFTNEYYENGGVKEIGKYENCKKTGFFVSYFTNGNKKEEGYYKDGKRSHLFVHHKEYYENGQLREKGNYENGKKMGDWEYFDKKGKTL